jgi:AraC family ethanolamine operon transcriptional activator
MLDATLLREEFAEADDLTARLRGVVVHGASLLPSAAARYAGVLTTLSLDGVTLQVVRSAPMLFLGAAEDRRVGLVQTLEGAARARWDGRPTAPSQVAVFADGRRHEAIYPDAFACAVLSVTGAAAAGAVWPRRRIQGSRMAPRQASGGLIPRRTRPRRPSRAVERSAAAGDGCSVLGDAEARRGLRAAVLDAARRLLMPASVTQRTLPLGGRARQRIVRETDAYLCANPMRPVYTDELCAALGVSATRLHQAFQATFGMGPHRYLKMRRMGMVRAALLARAGGPWRSVKAAALAHGFWHLGQFACDYRALYGEAPSETRARALGGAARPPPRPKPREVVSTPARRRAAPNAAHSSIPGRGGCT